MMRSKEYNAWANMRSRCNNPGSARYQRYGGRGVTVCQRWSGFKEFMEDMGLAPGPEYTLDRIDNNGNYSPENCRWATRAEQYRNQSRNVWYRCHGKKKCA